MNAMQKIVAVLLVALLLPTAAFANTQASSVVEIQLQSYTPAPAQPGDLLDVFIQVINNGNSEAQDILIEAVDRGAFTPEGVTQRRVAALGAGDVFTARFTVRVDSNAQAGERLLTLRTKQPSTDWQERTVALTVQSDEAALYVSELTTTPDRIQPGQEAELTLMLQNGADSRLRDVNVQLDLSETPFIPINGGSREQVDSISGQQTREAVFQLAIDPNAAADVYSIPVTLTFLDETGTESTQTDTIGVRVETPTNTKAYLDEVTKNADGVQVALRIVNKGLSEIKFVELRAEDGDGFSVLPQDKEVYVGNIDSDDWETIRMNVRTDGQSFDLPIEFVYQDAFNQERTVTDSFTIEVPQEEANQGPGIVSIIVLLVVVGAVIYFWRRRKKKKKK